MDSAEWDERYAAQELVWSTAPNRWVVEELGDEPAAGRAVDLGCGEGRNAVWLAERGWQVTAVDFAAVALQKGDRAAAARGLEIRWVHADVVTWQPDTTYALVLVCYLHLPAAGRRQVLRTAAAALAPGGVLLVIGHDSANLTDGVGGPQDADVLFTADDVRDDLGGTGLRIERASRVERGVEGADRPALDVVVRARR